MKAEACTVHGLAAYIAFPYLLEEYAEESAIAGLPPPSLRLPAYVRLEEAGMLHCIKATEEGMLAGFITILAPVLPHYGVAVAVAESFFVGKVHRASMAGLKLLVAAEEKAKELGSPGLLVSAPFGGKLFEVLPKCGYAETNRVFFKKLLDA